MELPNVYEIAKADFTADVTANTTTNNLTVSYNPSLGDKGANIEAYESLAKPSYNAKSLQVNMPLQKVQITG